MGIPQNTRPVGSTSVGIPRGWELGGHLTTGSIRRTKRLRALPTVHASEPQFPSLYNGDNCACLQEDARQRCTRQGAQQRAWHGGDTQQRAAGSVTITAQPVSRGSLGTEPAGRACWSLQSGGCSPGQTAGVCRLCCQRSVGRAGLPLGAPPVVPANLINCLVLPPRAP